MTALLACGIAAAEFASDADADHPPLVWAPHLGPDSPTAHRDAIIRQASLLALELIETTIDPPPGDAPVGMLESHLLLHAGHLAARHGCGQVVWPVQFASPTDDPPALERIAEAVDRALLASRVVTLDAGHYGLTEIAIDAPFADLSDRQVAELAADMELPIETCWWWSALGAHGSGAGEERDRWTAALRAVGWVGLPAEV